LKAEIDGRLSEDQIAAFNEKGYVVVDFSLDPAILDRIVEKMEPEYGEDYRLLPTNPTRVQNAWKTIDEVRQLATDSRISVALEQLFGRKSLPFQTLNFPIGTRQCTHSDAVHFNSIPAGFMSGVWVALEDIDETNGALRYYPGSHKLAETSMQGFGLETGYEDYDKYEECVQKLIETQGLSAEYGTIKKGEALIWHPNLLHGGAPQTDLSRTRHSQVTHYFFENCKYYNPMENKSGKLKFHKPFWVPETADFILPEDMSKVGRLIYRLRRRLGIS